MVQNRKVGGRAVPSTELGKEQEKGDTQRMQQEKEKIKHREEVKMSVAVKGAWIPVERS